MIVSYDTTDFNLIHTLVGKYISFMKQMTPIQEEKESKQSFNKRQEYARGVIDTFAEAFEIAIASCRSARYGARIPVLPVPPGYEIQNTLFPALDEAYRLAKTAGKFDDTLFWEGVEPIIEQYIYTPELEELLDRERRQAILKGEEEPLDGDADWLEEVARSHEAKAADIRSRLP